ncbi:MAG: ATP-binding cassette domain-containing protein [Chloroflexota bacterium]|jgi:ABC-2 type transport system ATP-binding protein
MTPLAVDVRGVWKRYGETDVVSDLSFDVRPGEVLGFLGPNGSGKTTTMRMILDIVRPVRGEIDVFGEAPGVQHQERVGYLPEDRGLYRDVKIIDTLTYFGALRGMPQKVARDKAMSLMTEMGLADSAEKKAAELSRGMHQKAQLIATILNDPELLIIDEPFQGLDPVNADMLKGVVRAQKERGAAVIMSTHDMGDAQTLCDRILLIDKGHRLLYGTVDRVRDAFSDGAVQVSGANLPTTAEGLASVTDVHEVDGALRYLIREDATPQDLFRELAASGAEVERFAVQAPSLDEIFIRTVAGDHRAEAVR